MNVYLPARLPSTYQEVEYIQSSGTQYINTGYQPSSNTEVEGKINIQSFSAGNNYTIYGARNNDSGASRRAFAFQIDGDLAKFRATIYSNTGSYDIHIDSINTISTNTIYTFKQTHTNFYLNGTSQGTYSSSSYSVPYNMYIFAYNTGGSAGQQLSMRLYSLEIKDSGTLVRSFVPCYRKSDSVIGLYDLVNNQFYTNSGTGTFSKGNDVTMAELKNAYIGEVWTPNANTIAYYPLTSTSTVNDMSGNNRNLTNSGTTFGTYQGVDSGYINGYMYYTGISTPSNLTINIWYNLRTKSDGYYLMAGLKYGTSNSNVYGFLMAGEFEGRPNGQGFGTQYNNSSSSDNYGGLVNGTKSTIGTWYNGVVTYDGTTMKIYLNGTLASSANVSMTNARDTILLGYNSGSSKFNLSNAIFEDRLWTATEILNYYNNTKSNYGL